ncbi:MAG: glycosyltransferase [Bacteroidota bacterium]
MQTVEQPVIHQPADSKVKKDWGVALLGESGFPIGMAAIEKIKLLGRGLMHADSDVVVINRKGVFDPNNPIDLQPEGEIEGVPYVYTSGTIYRASGFIKRNIVKLKGLLGEYRYLKRMKREGKLHSSIVSTMRFSDFWFYRICANLLGFQLIFLYVELTRTLVDRKGFWVKLNDRLLDKYALRWSDGILPISDLLIKEIEEHVPEKPYLKVPVLCDFDKFNVPKKEKVDPYLLFCGSANYAEVIHFILDSYERLEFNGDPTYLYLLIGGKAEEKEKIQARIAGMERAQYIKWFSRIPYEDLIDLYVNAQGLLIPLRNTPQDRARFPHKIGEYLAAGNPVVTTHIGEIKNYFVNGETAYVADDYDVALYVAEMKKIIDDLAKAKAVGDKGHQMGLENFDYRSHGIKIRDFMEKIIQK